MHSAVNGLNVTSGKSYGVCTYHKKAPVHTEKHQTFSRTAVEANFLKLIKAIYERPTLIILNGKALVGFPGGSDGKESTCNAGDPGLISRLGRSPGEGNGNPFRHSCLENSMDRGAWQATVLGIAKSRTCLSN